VEALKENDGYVMWTRFDSIKIVGVLDRDCAVDVGAVGEVDQLQWGHDRHL